MIWTKNKRKEYMKKYRECNKDQIKKYREDHKEEFNKWRQENLSKGGRY